MVVSWSHAYWPMEKVQDWLKDRWHVWQQRPPKWFDELFKDHKQKIEKGEKQEADDQGEDIKL